MKLKLNFFILIISSIILNNIGMFNNYNQQSEQIVKQLPDGGDGPYYLDNSMHYVSKNHHSLSVTKRDFAITPIELFYVFEWEIGKFMPALDKKMSVDSDDTLFSKINWNYDDITDGLTLMHLYNNVKLGNASTAGYVNDLRSARNYANKYLLNKVDLIAGGVYEINHWLDAFKTKGKINVQLATGFTWYRSQANAKFYLQFIVYFYAIYSDSYPLSLWINLGRSFKLV